MWLDGIARRQSSIAEAPGSATESADKMTSSSPESEIAGVETAAADPPETAPIDSTQPLKAPPVASVAAPGVLQDTAKKAEPESSTTEEPTPVEIEAASGEAL